MAGVLPRTAYLLTKNEMVVGEFSSRTDVAMHIGVSVDDNGRITFGGDEVGPKYSSEWANKDEIVRDWARYHMKMPSGYKIYRYLI